MVFPLLFPVPRAFLQLVLLAVLLANPPALAQEVNDSQPELSADYPPKMGEISGTLGGVPLGWETFDFSIGAFDASAWAGTNYESGIVSAYLNGYPPGDPDALAGRIHVSAAFGRALKTGKGRRVSVEIRLGELDEGPGLSSQGQAASFVIDSIGPAVENSYSRHVTGHIEARLCPINGAGQTCQDLLLTFDTDMQMESTLKVQD